jgi:hypothetical protein
MGASFSEQMLARGGYDVDWPASSRFHNGGLGSNLDRGHMLRCVRREEVSSGAIVASLTGLIEFMSLKLEDCSKVRWAVTISIACI